MKTPYIKRMESLFNKEDIPCELLEKSVAGKIDQLFIPFQGTSIGLAITALPPELMAEAGPNLGLQLVQYHVALPVDVVKGAAISVSKIMNRLNILSPIPGWTFDVTDSVIHFRYVSCSKGDVLHKEEVTYILQLIMFYMNTYIPLLEELVHGKAKYLEVSERLNKAMAA